jgi:predicted nucleic acid-binding protein
VFLDSSVMISASGSEKSLSRLIVTLADKKGWDLITAAYCRAETNRNVVKFGSEAVAHWEKMKIGLGFVPDALTSTRPLLLTAAKDKPVLISALAAESQVLLTLDRCDFGIILETEVYGMLVTTPRGFLVREGLG